MGGYRLPVSGYRENGFLVSGIQRKMGQMSEVGGMEVKYEVKDVCQSLRLETGNRQPGFCANSYKR